MFKWLNKTDENNFNHVLNMPVGQPFRANATIERLQAPYEDDNTHWKLTLTNGNATPFEHAFTPAPFALGSLDVDGPQAILCRIESATPINSGIRYSIHSGGRDTTVIQWSSNAGVIDEMSHAIEENRPVVLWSVKPSNNTQGGHVGNGRLAFVVRDFNLLSPMEEEIAAIMGPGAAQANLVGPYNGAIQFVRPGFVTMVGGLVKELYFGYIELQGNQNVAIAMQVANIAAVEPEMPQLPFGLVPTEGEHFVLHGPNDYPELGITGCYEVTIQAVPAAENPEVERAANAADADADAATANADADAGLDAMQS
jgi:hypothetical protein